MQYNDYYQVRRYDMLLRQYFIEAVVNNIYKRITSVVLHSGLLFQRDLIFEELPLERENSSACCKNTLQTSATLSPVYIKQDSMKL